jgi:hypothetical protein
MSVPTRSWASRVEAPREDIGFRTLYRHRPQCEQVVDPDIAHLVTAMLERVVAGGTGTAAGNIGRPVAGKTGTAQDYTNVYFAGYTPQIATAVWVGFPSGQIPMDDYYGSSVFGGRVAAPIWHAFMLKAMQGYEVEGFEPAPAPQSGKVPDVVGLTSAEAQQALADANFTPIVEKVVSFQPVGTVLSQAPGGGASAVLGSAVTIQVSNEKGEPIIVPRVTGLSKVQAVKVLEDLGLVASIELVSVGDESQDGIVLSQVPIGNGAKMVDAGATVTLQVGRLDGEGGGGSGPTGPTGGGPTGPSGPGP